MTTPKAGLSACLLAIVLALSACAVIPHKKDDATISKVAANEQTAVEVFERYTRVLKSARELGDSQPLSTVDDETVLAIDSGSFEVAQRAASKNKSGLPEGEILASWAPRLKKYPLWFLLRVKDESRDTIKMQLFEKKSAASQWLLASTPEMLPTTKLPEIASKDGTLVPVDESDSRGMDLDAKQALKYYVAALNTPDSPSAAKVLDDGFRRQMRDAVATEKALKGVTFSQQWGSEGIDHSVRTSDGGALVFSTLLRRDTYDVKKGLSVTWPDGSPQKTFLGKEISKSGSLNFYHQILLYVPGSDGGVPRVLGQFGGVVGAKGD